MGDTPVSASTDNEDLVLNTDPVALTAGQLRTAGFAIDPSVPDNATVGFDLPSDTPKAMT